MCQSYMETEAKQKQTGSQWMCTKSSGRCLCAVRGAQTGTWNNYSVQLADKLCLCFDVCCYWICTRDGKANVSRAQSLRKGRIPWKRGCVLPEFCVFLHCPFSWEAVCPAGSQSISTHGPADTGLASGPPLHPTVSHIGDVLMSYGRVF